MNIRKITLLCGFIAVLAVTNMLTLAFSSQIKQCVRTIKSSFESDPPLRSNAVRFLRCAGMTAMSLC